MSSMIWLASLVSLVASEAVEIPVEVSALVETSNGTIEKFQQIINFRVDPQSQVVHPEMKPVVFDSDESGGSATVRCLDQSKRDMDAFAACMGDIVDDLTRTMNAMKTDMPQQPLHTNAKDNIDDANIDDGKDIINAKDTIDDVLNDNSRNEDEDDSHANAPKAPPASAQTTTEQPSQVANATELHTLQHAVFQVLRIKWDSKHAKLKNKVKDDAILEKGRGACLRAFCKDGEESKLLCDQTPFFWSCMLGVARGYSVDGNRTANESEIKCGIEADRSHDGTIREEEHAEFISCLEMRLQFVTPLKITERSDLANKSTEESVKVNEDKNEESEEKATLREQAAELKSAVIDASVVDGSAAAPA